MYPATKRRNLQDPQQILEALERFLAAAHRPAFVEAGHPAIAIDRERLELRASTRGVLLEIWGPEGSIVRRLTALKSESRSKIVVEAHRFGAAPAQVALLDQAVQTRTGSHTGHSSEAFLQRLLARNFPTSLVGRLSGSSDLQNSLSGRYVRCVAEEGEVAWAVIAAPPLSGFDACNTVITAALLWLQKLREDRGHRPVVGARIILPRGREVKTARLLLHLDATRAAYQLFAYDESGTARLVDPQDAGNDKSRLGVYRVATPHTAECQRWIETLESLDQVETVVQANGRTSIRVNGLEFASIQGRQMEFGVDSRSAVAESNFGTVVQLAEQLSRFRSPQSKSTEHPLFRATPELWLESQLRRDIGSLDPTLGRCPIYSQPVAARGIDRGILDLLTLDTTGRLAVIEVKATANLQLPVQSLDYWSQLTGLSRQVPSVIQQLFPRQPVSADLPRLILVAPALEFHSSTETILRFFAPDIPLERIGVNHDWRLNLRKRFHLRGPKRPAFNSDGA